MAVNADFRDLFAALNDEGGRYLVVGGYALAFFGHPRFTRDLDVWVEASAENAERVFRALEVFGAPMADLTREDLAKPDLVFQIGVAPNRIDIVTGIDGVTFADAWETRESSTYGALQIQVIGRSQLIQNKKASGRPQDLADLQALEESS